MSMPAEIIFYIVFFKQIPKFISVFRVFIKADRMKGVTTECRFMSKWNYNIAFINSIKGFFQPFYIYSPFSV